MSHGTCCTPKPVLAAREHGAAEHQDQRHLAVPERVQVARRRSRRSRRCTAAAGRPRCSPVNPWHRGVALHPQERPRVCDQRSRSPNRARRPALVLGRSGAAAARSAPGSAARSRAPRRRSDSPTRSRTRQLRRGGVRLGAMSRTCEGPVRVIAAATAGRTARPRPSRRTPPSAARASCAAVEATPGHAHPADQLVARVDRHQVAVEARPALGRAQTSSASTSGQQVAQRRVGRDDALPCRQRQLRLGGTGRARVERDHPLLHRVAEEERQPDRDLQLVPVAPASSRKSGNDR